MIGKFDAAVIDKEDGKPHVVKRVDHPHYRVIPEWFGSGTLPRKELHEAAEALDAGQAALVVVGEPTIAQGVERAIMRSAKTFIVFPLSGCGPRDPGVRGGGDLHDHVDLCLKPLMHSVSPGIRFTWTVASALSRCFTSPTRPPKISRCAEPRFGAAPGARALRR
ncbi:MAG: hypothetical protein WAL38_19555, partial [Solirubrobacteraceae bacterium]